MARSVRSQVLAQLDRVASRMNRSTFRSESHDIVDLAFFRAGLDAAEFYEAHLLGAKAFVEQYKMLDRALSFADPRGLFLEFGVASGGTIRHIATSHTGPVYGFDSFEGLPEDWYGEYQTGSFSQTKTPAVPKNVQLVNGWFDQTLTGWLNENPGEVSFIHIDCDLYSSTKFVLETLRERISSGCVIQFDEFFNYPGWREHEYRAWIEFVDLHGIKFRYDSFLRNAQAVSVIIE